MFNKVDKKRIDAHRGDIVVMGEYIVHSFVSDKEDTLLETTRGYGDTEKPEDYLEAFAKFVNENKDEIEAIRIACTKPSDMTRAQLRDLKDPRDPVEETTATATIATTDVLREETVSVVTATVLSRETTKGVTTNVNA